MPELDYTREAVPHLRGQQAPIAVSDTDAYCRTHVLPLLFQLDKSQRDLFDEQLLERFAPEIEEPTRFAAQQILRRLDIAQLHLVAIVTQAFLDNQQA